MEQKRRASARDLKGFGIIDFQKRAICAVAGYGYWILDTGFWIFDAGWYVLDRTAIE